MKTVQFVLGLVALILLLLTGLVAPLNQAEEPIDNSCLVDYQILLPQSAMLAGRLLVDETGLPFQQLNNAGFIFIDGVQHYFIDGVNDYVQGELCWIGDPANPEPVFLDTSWGRDPIEPGE
jgi:hypothetical protein